jgi:hypothetical protein
MDNGIETYVLPGENKRINGIWYFIPDIDQLRTDLSQDGFLADIAPDIASKTSER